MIRFLIHPDGSTWLARCVDEDVVITLTRAGVEEISLINTYEEVRTPPEYYVDHYVDEMLSKGFERAPIPNVATEIEEAHSVKLPTDVRAFYDEETYLQYQGYYCSTLDCHVDFVSDAVLGNYMQEHYDSTLEKHRVFVPISARVINGKEDEQSWIGIDPDESDGPVYGLYTSGEFEVAFENFRGFLDQLKASK